MISQANKEILVKRSKSFIWRLGMMLLATVLAFILDNLNLLELSPAVIGVLGLLLGEVSKQVNNYLSQ